MARKIMSQGFGPSKAFISPDAPVNDVQEWTVNGKPWSEIDPILRAAIPFENTDQGRAQKAAERPTSPHRVSISDPVDRDLERRIAEAEEGRPTVISGALAEAAAPYVRQGFVPGFKNPDVVKQNGFQGWVPVRDANGDVVKVGEMICSEIPEGEYKRRQDEPMRAAENRLKQIDENFNESGGRIAREGITPAALRDLASGSDSSDFQAEERSSNHPSLE